MSMQTVKELQNKFESYEQGIACLLQDIRLNKMTSDSGFKQINQLLVEIKTLVGKFSILL